MTHVTLCLLIGKKMVEEGMNVFQYVCNHYCVFIRCYKFKLTLVTYCALENTLKFILCMNITVNII